MAVRYLDFNDTYLSLEPLHPSDVIAPLLALAEARAIAPGELMAGIAVAYEIGVGLCDAGSLRAHGWDHVNYIAVGVAAGAGRMLGLDAARDRARDLDRHRAARGDAPDARRRAQHVEGGGGGQRLPQRADAARCWPRPA